MEVTQLSRLQHLCLSRAKRHLDEDLLVKGHIFLESRNPIFVMKVQSLKLRCLCSLQGTLDKGHLVKGCKNLYSCHKYRDSTFHDEGHLVIEIPLPPVLTTGQEALQTKVVQSRDINAYAHYGFRHPTFLNEGHQIIKTLAPMLVTGQDALQMKVIQSRDINAYAHSKSQHLNFHEEFHPVIKTLSLMLVTGQGTHQTKVITQEAMRCRSLPIFFMQELPNQGTWAFLFMWANRQYIQYRQ